jgi:hypothetical protein
MGARARQRYLEILISPLVPEDFRTTDCEKATLCEFFSGDHLAAEAFAAVGGVAGAIEETAQDGYGAHGAAGRGASSLPASRHAREVAPLSFARLRFSRLRSNPPRFAPMSSASTRLKV